MLRAIQRHREVFQENARELKRTKVCQTLFHSFNQYSNIYPILVECEKRS